MKIVLIFCLKISIWIIVLYLFLEVWLYLYVWEAMKKCLAVRSYETHYFRARKIARTRARKKSCTHFCVFSHNAIFQRRLDIINKSFVDFETEQKTIVMMVWKNVWNKNARPRRRPSWPYEREHDFNPIETNHSIQHM